MIEEVIGLQIRVKWLSLDWNPGLYSTKVQVLHHNTNQFGGEEWGVRVVTKIDKTKQKKQKPNLFDIVHTSYRNRTSLSLKVRKIIYHLIKKKCQQEEENLDLRFTLLFTTSRKNCCSKYIYYSMEFS